MIELQFKLDERRPRALSLSCAVQPDGRREYTCAGTAKTTAKRGDVSIDRKHQK